MPTKIEWTNETWNPIIGCSKISAGCQNCYAEKMAKRIFHCLNHIGKQSETLLNYSEALDENLNWKGKAVFCQNILTNPSKWKTPRKVFVCSMGDLFHESVPFEWIDAVFSVMSDNDQHVYQVLTKRPERMLAFYQWKSLQFGGIEWQVKNNVWLGVTVESEEQKYRILQLLQVPAKIHFVSIEPMLTGIDLYPWLDKYIGPSDSGHHSWLNGLDWVIVGPETGKKPRPIKKEWVVNIFGQCTYYKVPLFDKKNILEENIQQFPTL
jgi:protein gp37